MRCTIVNKVGCQITNNFTEEDLTKFKKLGWKVVEEQNV